MLIVLKLNKRNGKLFINREVCRDKSMNAVTTKMEHFAITVNRF